MPFPTQPSAQKGTGLYPLTATSSFALHVLQKYLCTSAYMEMLIYYMAAGELCKMAQFISYQIWTLKTYFRRICPIALLFPGLDKLQE